MQNPTPDVYTNIKTLISSIISDKIIIYQRLSSIDYLSTMNTATTDLEALAELCLQSAKTIKGFVAVNGPSKLAFDTQALPSFPQGDEMTQRARNDLRNAAKTLYDLVTGPQECLMESSLTSVSLLCDS